MDSWKPQQLRLMELGGNRKLREFLRKHKILDNTPIAVKYNTRAADWYRRHLRALADGSEPPPPLPEGTGHLQLNESLGQQRPIKLTKTFATEYDLGNHGGAVSCGAGGGGGGGYHDDRGGGAYHFGGAVGSAPRGRMEGFGSDDVKPGGSHRAHMEGFGSEDITNRRGRMEGFGNDVVYGGGRLDGFGSEPEWSGGGGAGAENRRNADDFTSGVLGQHVSTKVADGLLSALGAAKCAAGIAKEYAESRVAQAQTEGWLDTAMDTAKQATEAGKRIVSDGTGKAVMDKTTEVLGALGGQLGGGVPKKDNAEGLARLSTGRMQGFGSDSFFAAQDATRQQVTGPPSYHQPLAAGPSCAEELLPAAVLLQAAPVPATRAVAKSRSVIDMFDDDSWEEQEGQKTEAHALLQTSSRCHSQAPMALVAPVAAPAAPPVAPVMAPPQKKADVWNDDDWGD
eukprot:NODE_3976_length_1954_cov_4.209633.p1 GENE.NODE_3976_length_1954_cov_4.209633~~NODE_3976_length_1954_cov_4.209633.p1  ORF type:complete len:523 (-),score=136.10 NODE_3976_length_1954_cov_4.209633:384-1745(-)